MIYKFSFTQKPFKTVMKGQVKTDHFYKWFMENAPFGARLESHKQIIEMEKGITDYTNGFDRLKYEKEINH